MKPNRNDEKSKCPWCGKFALKIEFLDKNNAVNGKLYTCKYCGCFYTIDFDGRFWFDFGSVFETDEAEVEQRGKLIICSVEKL